MTLSKESAVVNNVQSYLMQDESIVISQLGVTHTEDTCSLDYYPSAGEPVNSWRYEYMKRGLDLLSATILLLVFAVPGLLIAAVIVLTSQGPVFFREERIGRGGRPFQIWKFRSMCRRAEQSRYTTTPQPGHKAVHRRMQKHLPDPRITLFGRFLRQWSLDELPQLLNVLRGEMSLVGPRPIVEAETAFYKDRLGFYLSARPGLSGLWQVSGRSNLGYEVRAGLDAMYVQSWNLRGDLYILLRTIPAVVRRIGAH
jgi:lipopolysaccharide/colanic/teichoic acid biosynthesis glycosyltransferase